MRCVALRCLGPAKNTVQTSSAALRGQDSSSSLGKMPSCHRCSSSVKIEENMATCPICATHYHNAFDCGERIKKSCIANGCSMNVLEAAAQCPKCAKICICAGGHVRHDSLPFFLTAFLLACLLFTCQRAKHKHAHFYTTIKTTGEVPRRHAAPAAPAECQ